MDLSRFRQDAERMKHVDLDYAAFRDQPLSNGALRAVRYMADVESHTILYLRDLLVTPSHKDARVTEFLIHWAYGEYWHGEALGEVLRMHGLPARDQRVRQVRRAQGLKDRWMPVGQSLLANTIGDDYVAVQMAWGAVNAWCTLAAYQRLRALEPHPVLAQLIERIERTAEEGGAFFGAQTRHRLERSATARRLARFALRAAWTPVGSSIQPRSESAFAFGYLLTGAEGIAVVEQVDRKVDRLPGLAGMHLARRGVGGFGTGPGARRGLHLPALLRPPRPWRAWRRAVR
ncbi:MAG: hypothetical protein ACRDMV_06770 [Streptosporangiales bacterium]